MSPWRKEKLRSDMTAVKKSMDEADRNRKATIEKKVNYSAMY